ncbi:MAG TPA: carboxypeptidase-like regulatory domain-containing protein [Pyrinomonadaceae bacterium]|nr:carboxypeptidase-like regulatory domain-containing protein [Pyrinomonadaceae bacterium]
MKPDPLKNLRIASPCPMNWDQMTGDNRARFCSLCNLHVYNIAELTRKQAVALITETEGRICGRIYRRSDGTVITKDCPVGLRAIRRRVARTAGAVFATLVALTSSAFGQSPSKKDHPSCKQQVTISRKESDTEPGAFTGTVVDANGAYVAGVRIKITDRKSGKSIEVASNDEGRFRTEALGASVYDVSAESAGFKKLEIAQLTIAAKETVTLTLILTVADPATEVLVGVVLVEPMVDTTKPGLTYTITSDIFRRLPIP